MADRVALITGASSGIGWELAKLFAAGGARVALVARRRDRLEELASVIAKASPTAPPPLVIECDLSRPDAGDRVAAALAAAGAEVEFLVNNAGFGLFGDAGQRDRGEQLEMIDLNVRTLADLSLRFAGQLARHKGGLLNVASVAAFLPGPHMAVYYSTKAFVLSFSEALHAEWRPLGVRVTALCPGPVVTGFQQRAGVSNPIDQRMVVAAADVALAGYAGLMAGTRVVVPGGSMKFFVAALRVLPRGLVLRLIDRGMQRRA